MKPQHNAANAPVALVSEEDIQGCRNSLLWSLRAVGTAVGLLGIKDEEFQQWVVEDEDYFLMVLQLLKMLAVDQGYAENVADVREKLQRKIAQAVAVRNDPDTEALIAAEIDFDLLPPMPDFSGGHDRCAAAVRPRCPLNRSMTMSYCQAFSRQIVDPNGDLISIKQNCSVQIDFDVPAVVVREGGFILGFYDGWGEGDELVFIRDALIAVLLDPFNAVAPDWRPLFGAGVVAA